MLSPFSGEDAPRVPLDRLPVHWHRGSLAAVDADAHTVTTTDGGEIGYDRLIVATGARAVEGVPGAVTFRGPISAGAVEGALRSARGRALFVLPADTGWPLPIYELALLAAHEFPDGPEIVVVSPEPRPLDVFGPVASDALARLLDRAGIVFIGDTRAAEVMGDALVTDTGALIAADAIIALPRLNGRASPASPAMPTASWRSTRTRASSAWTTCSPRAMPRPDRSSRAASRPSRPMPPPRRSPPPPAPRSIRGRAATSCAASC